jgi:hypothetical protein
MLYPQPDIEITGKLCGLSRVGASVLLLEISSQSIPNLTIFCTDRYEVLIGAFSGIPT